MYATKVLAAPQLVELILTVDGLTAQVDPADGQLTSVSRVGSGAYCFTIDGPFTIEPDDMPDEVRSARPTVLYQMVVQGSASENVPFARRFSERLAAFVDGVLVDPQAKNHSHARTPSPPSTKVTAGLYLHLCWYRQRDDTKEFAAQFLEAAEEHFPAAVPTRFGTHEPFQGKFPRDEPSQFGRVYREECDVSPLLFKGTAIKYGSVSGWTNSLEARYQELHVSFDLDHLTKKRLLGTVEAFLSEVAVKTGSFFAFAEVNSSKLDTAIVPAVRGAWAGMPPRPQWLMWFSSEYAELVRPHLAAGVTEDGSVGSLHRWTEEPAEASEIESWLIETPWVPFELLPVSNPDNYRRPYDQAHLMPDPLRAPAQGSPEWRRIESNYARASSTDENR
ncbi:hypothetical protein [Microbacterium sp. PMB16]|uniref:hypothetical protein n=1 Tax=Microbacterium sp. PMB16 TaxID=3120157 RepID=UPI003F4BFCB5